MNRYFSVRLLALVLAGAGCAESAIAGQWGAFKWGDGTVWTPPTVYSSNYKYDALGRLLTETDQATANGTTLTGMVNYAYDAPGNRTIMSTSLAPVAYPVTATVYYNSANNNIPLSLTGAPATSVTVSTQASHGTATANGTSITYTPASGYLGSDSFQYTATNSYGASAPGTVSISVTVQPPVANPFSISVGYNSGANSVPVSSNITGGTATSVAVSTPAGHGTATANGASISYTPNRGYNGSDWFWYTASNGGGTSSPARVSVTVDLPPSASDVTASVYENASNNPSPSYPITLSTIGDVTSVAVSRQAMNGTATANGTSITYTPNSGYVGNDTFQYTASNVGGTSAPATASITVNSTTPVANPASINLAYTIAGGTMVTPSGAVNPLSNDSSPLGFSLTVTGVTQPARGTVTFTNNSVSYTYYKSVTAYAGNSYTDQDSFTYTISDGHGGTATATVTVTINIQSLSKQ